MTILFVFGSNSILSPAQTTEGVGTKRDKAHTIPKQKKSEKIRRKRRRKEKKASGRREMNYGMIWSSHTSEMPQNGERAAKGQALNKSLLVDQQQYKLRIPISSTRYYISTPREPHCTPSTQLDGMGSSYYKRIGPEAGWDTCQEPIERLQGYQGPLDELTGLASLLLCCQGSGALVPPFA